MKQKLRRFMAGFLAILTMFTTLFTNGTTAFAASSSANIAFWVASSKDHGVISEFNSKHTGSILYAMIDGHSAYCMNFGLSAKGGQLMNSDSNPNTNLSAAQEVSILFDASKNSISSFIINLLQSVNVNDIMLSDIGIDEIVKKAYSREV